MNALRLDHRAYQLTPALAIDPSHYQILQHDMLHMIHLHGVLMHRGRLHANGTLLAARLMPSQNFKTGSPWNLLGPETKSMLGRAMITARGLLGMTLRLGDGLMTTLRHVSGERPALITMACVADLADLARLRACDR